LSSAPLTTAEYWDRYRPHCERPVAARFDWTGIPGCGPGAEVLGAPRVVLDLGPAEGENAAFLAQAGAEVTGVDLSPVQIARAREFWGGVRGLAFVQAEVCAYLDEEPRLFDTIYSTWGAVWFTDPAELLPRVAKRLMPGGTFAFSHREPIPGSYGARPMSGKWLEGRETELTVLRWEYPPERWADLLKRHGFGEVRAEVIPSPEADAPGTLLVTAQGA
jgi:SAM-dependent methyltransferase